MKTILSLIATLSCFGITVRAQTCVNDAPNPYHLVSNWVQMPRPWGSTNSVSVDSHNNVWVFDRCENNGCAASQLAPIWQVSSNGKVLRNFGAGMFIFPHQIVANPDGSVWLVDGDVKASKGNQVMKLSPDGKLLMTLGKAGQTGSGLDVFNRPTAVAISRNGDIFVSEGHSPDFGNSRIMKFDKNGKFIKSFGRLGSADGELKGPHGLAFDSQGRLFVADRSNNRIVIFDQNGKFLENWKQFGRPSGLSIDRNDMLYVADSQSEDAPGQDTNSPGCKQGIRIGSAKSGMVSYLIPPPPVSDPSVVPPEGVAADANGAIYAAGVQAKTVYKFVKN